MDYNDDCDNNDDNYRDNHDDYGVRAGNTDSSVEG